MKKVLLTLLVTTLSLATVADSAQADKLCLKVAFNKKTSKVTTSSTVATTCPAGFRELVDTSTFVGLQGAAGTNGSNGATGAAGSNGANGTNGTNGQLNLASCRNEVVTFASCPAGLVCGSTLQCGGAGTSGGSALRDYMVHFSWSLSNAAYVSESYPLFVVQGSSRYPTGITVWSRSEETYGAHVPQIDIVCCLPN